MPSQIKVDEIKNVAGQYKIKTNVLEGQTTAGSIVVTDGSTTASLQKGLGKIFINFNGESTVSTRASINVSSLDDDGTGEYGINYSSNMDNNTYFPSGMSEEDGKVTIVANSYNTNVATNLLNIKCKSGGSTIDREVISVTIHGDLA